MRILLISASCIALAACGFNGTDNAQSGDDVSATATNTLDSLADTMASRDPEMGESVTNNAPDSEDRPIMQVQVILDRQGFGPGVIDGKMGLSTENALSGFQESVGLDLTGKIDEATKKKLAQWENIAATRVVKIPENWGTLSLTPLPDGAAEKAKLDELGYNSLDEKLAERFHTTIDVLKMLNPGGKPAGKPGGKQGEADGGQKQSPATKSSEKPTSGNEKTGPSDDFFTAGQMIRVPNIGADRIAPGAISKESWAKTLASLGVGSEQPEVKKIVVSKSAGTLKAFGANGKLVALFTVTTGSEKDPLPLGNWEINGVAYNPPFSYNPELFWDVSDDAEKLQMPPGPNGPVGVVWIDLSKEHYGIHGTPAPETIGRAQSHGCVRLTNWDAARLAGMVSTGTTVLFEA